MDMMPIQDEFLSGKFTGNYSLGKRWGCHFGKLIITKEGSPGMAILQLYLF
jgi:hypothetical protein